MRLSSRAVFLSISLILAPTVTTPLLSADLAPVAESATRPQSARRALLRTDREKFSQLLYLTATKLAGRDTAEFYAIVRRGLDRFDEMTDVNGRMPTDWRRIDISQLSAEPEAPDRDPSGQYLTLLRLNVEEDTGQRMVGSRVVALGQFREVVALAGAGNLCTGIALNATTVLTAAHCACDLRLNRDGDLLDDAKKIYVGDTVQASDSRSYAIDLHRTVFFSGTPPCGDAAFAASLGNGKADLAVIRLAAGQSMNVPGVTIASPQLLSQSIGPVPKLFMIIGFGCSQPIQSGGRLYGCRKEKAGAKLRGGIVDAFHCGVGMPTQYGAPQSFCVPGQRELVLTDLRSENERVDSCGGDSGGPVFLVKDLKAQLVGITSRSLDPRGACGAGGIYGKVATAEVIDWLTGILHASP